jgi:DNA gyrase subunit A
VTLREGDELVFCSLSSGSDSVIIATAKGQGIRFDENEVRVMGRQASGVIGIRLKKDDMVVGMEVVGADEVGDILFATQNGYGKKVRAIDFRVAHRGGVGVRTIPTDKRNGPVIGLTIVRPAADILLIDQAGKIIRLPASEVRTMGRQAKGVRLIKLDQGQALSSVVAFEEHETASNNPATPGVTPDGAPGSAGQPVTTQPQASSALHGVDDEMDDFASQDEGELMHESDEFDEAGEDEPSKDDE